MKGIFLILAFGCFHLFGWTQTEDTHTSYFKAPWYFKNDFGYQLIISKGHFGIIDSNGVVVCEPQFDQIHDFDGDYAIVELNGLKGIIHRSGNSIAAPEFQELDGFRNGWAVGRNHLITTYIDTNGAQRRGPTPNFHDFRNGPKRSMKKEHICYVNENDRIVIGDDYTRGDPFQNGYTIVQKDEQQFLIDSLGNKLHVFDDDLVSVSSMGPYVQVWNDGKRGMCDFAGNMLIPCEYEEMEFEKDGVILVKKNYKWGAYNWKFEQIIPTIYDRINYVNNVINRNKKVMVNDGQLKGLVDFEGNTILKCMYSDIQFNEDGSMISMLMPTDPTAIQALEYLKKNDFEAYKTRIDGQFGYEIWGKNGVPLLEGKYYFAKQVHNKYFMVSELTGIHLPYNYGFHRIQPMSQPMRYSTIGKLIDSSTGEIIFEDYSDYSYVKDGVFACRDTNVLIHGLVQDFNVILQGEKATFPELSFWKLFDLTGKEIPTPKNYFIAEPTPYGLIVCREVEETKTYAYGMTNFEGNIIIPLDYDEITPFYGSSYQIKKDGLYGIANPVAKTVGACASEWISNELRLSGLLFVGAKGKVGYIDALGNELIPCIYDFRRDDFRNGKTYFMFGNERIYLGKDGREVE